MSQQSAFPVQGGDLPVTNYGATDIPAGKAVKLDTTAGNHLGVLALGATDGDKAFAVTLDTIKAGKAGRVRALGAAVMTADGAITAGDWIAPSVDAGEEGDAKPTAAGTTGRIGRALTSAADNADVVVWLCPRAASA